MSIGFSGLHHVTAIAGDPQENVDFYSGVLGLRLVKKTVNFDDPLSYHLYYGDAAGNPGTIMTFFSWPDAPQGRAGTGHIVATSFAVPEDSLGYWTERLVEHGIRFEKPERRFDETVLAFGDPARLAVELVARPGRSGGEAWEDSPVPAEYAIRGLPGVTLWEQSGEATANFLTNLLGFEKVGEEDGRSRYLTANSGGGFADVLVRPGGPVGRISVGMVHHVAWRAPDDDVQEAWREELEGRGFQVTDVRDRVYFNSIYFREPGGVIFEIATDPPGFTADEDKEHLGERLMLPPWLEEHRERIEAFLPPVRQPHQKG